MRGSMSENCALVTWRERLSDGRRSAGKSVPASGNSAYKGVGALIITMPGHLNAASGMMSVAGRMI